MPVSPNLDFSTAGGAVIGGVVGIEQQAAATAFLAP
jgi:hypothetical protein